MLCELKASMPAEDANFSAKGRRVAFYNSMNRPEAPGCTLQRYVTTTRTNWHYECAQALMDGRLGLPG